MILHGYDGVIENPLSRVEGIELTVALGAAHRGDDYYNADVFGAVLHHGGTGYIKSEMDRDPQAFAERVDEQIDELKVIIAPYIGRWAAAKHGALGLEVEDSWVLWQRSSSGTECMHTSGVILGVAGVKMDKRMLYNFEYPNDLSRAYEATWKRHSYKIGVLLDTTHTRRSFSYGVEAPAANKMLVPVRGFPGNKKYFNGLWSWQLSGTEKVG